MCDYVTLSPVGETSLLHVADCCFCLQYRENLNDYLTSVCMLCLSASVCAQSSTVEVVYLHTVWSDDSLFPEVVMTVWCWNSSNIAGASFSMKIHFDS